MIGQTISVFLLVGLKSGWWPEKHGASSRGSVWGAMPEVLILGEDSVGLVARIRPLLRTTRGYDRCNFGRVLGLRLRGDLAEQVIGDGLFPIGWLTQ